MAQLLIEEALELHVDELDRRARQHASNVAAVREAEAKVQRELAERRRGRG